MEDNTRLILQNPRDWIIARSEEIKEETQRKKKLSEEEKRLAYLKRLFKRFYFKLSLAYFRFGKAEVQKFNEDRLRGLEELISERAIVGSVISKGIFYNPIGWFLYGIWYFQQKRFFSQERYPRTSNQWNYRYIRGELERAYGKNWFIEEVVRKSDTFSVSKKDE